jgi:hypothetical protein
VFFSPIEKVTKNEQDECLASDEEGNSVIWASEPGLSSWNIRKSDGIRLRKNGSALCAVALQTTLMKKMPAWNWNSTSVDCQQGTLDNKA